MVIGRSTFPVCLRSVASRAAVLIVTALGVPDAALGQDRGNPDWNYVVHPQLWFAKVEGDVLVDDAELSVGDDRLVASFFGAVEGGKGRWKGIGTFRTTGLSGMSGIAGDALPDDLEGAFDFHLTVAELFAAVEFGSFETSQALEFLGGLRYVRHALDIEVQPGTQVVREWWMEPVVGARYYAEMGRRFWATIDGNIGGFGIGSEIAWVVAGTLGVRISERLDATLATRYYQTEYRNPDNGYLWDQGSSQGWHFGLRWKG